jgi:O-succinylbenzoic acid--CoA ligase
VPAVRHWLPFEGERSAWDRLPDAARAMPDRSAVGEDDPFCILYTSGTTGRPKGAVLTHLGLVTNCIGAGRHLCLRDGESMILSVPGSHVTGLMLNFLLSVRVAGKVVIQRGFKARPFLELAERERMSFAIMVPAMYNLCLMDPDYDRFDLSGWRIGAYGGAPVPEVTIAALAERTPGLTLVNIYGSTETSSPAVMMPLGEGRARLSQVGRALPYADILVMDDSGRQVGPGQQGEIWIAGPMVVPRYWNNPDATGAGFLGGYWKSGDIGVMDVDGYLSVLDRKKDMINRGGFKIYSVEVENVLMAHGDVAEAAVVGKPCPVLGERVEAFVVAREAVQGDDLRAYCASRLSDYKVPDHVFVVPGPLPRNPNGKLLKNVVRTWLSEAAA